MQIHSDTESLASSTIEREIKRLRSDHWRGTLEGWDTDIASAPAPSQHEDAPAPKKGKITTPAEPSGDEADDEATSDEEPLAPPP